MSDIVRSGSVTTGDATAIEYCFEQGWTDGLPVVPPTRALVDAFLAAGGVEADELLGEIVERSRPVYAEKVAANAVLAGCRPEYMPVVLAAVRALCRPEANAHVPTLSTSGSAALLLVNGRVARSIGMNSGANLFGSGNRPNATIGRALRLVIMNILGSRTGTFDRSALGHPGKYTFCIAEDEEDSPWPPFHVSRGFDASDSVVTLVFSDAPRQIRDDSSDDPLRLIRLYATLLKGCYHTGGTFVLVLNPDHRAVFREAGWSRERICELLIEEAVMTAAELKRSGRMQGEPTPDDELIRVPFIKTPDDLILVAAGGPGVFSAVVPPWAGGRHTRPVSVAVENGR